MALNLASVIRNSLRYFPGATALIHDEWRIDYRGLARQIEAFAAHLRGLGVEHGDRVVLFAPNRPSFTIAYFGILHAGAVVVPISYLSVGREVGYYLEDSEAVALVAWHGYADAARQGFHTAESCRTLFLFDEVCGPLHALESPAIDAGGSCEIAQTGPDDTAVILYTSGTTGSPKGAELTHFNMYSNAQYCAEKLQCDPERVEVFGPGNIGLAALPLFHSFGQTCIQNASLFGGAAMSYVERFDPARVLEIIERDRITLFAGVPTMYFALLHHVSNAHVNVSSLRFCNSGGSAMPVEVLHAFDEKFGVKVLEGYGLSETSPVATFNVLAKPRKPGSIGEAIYGCEVRVVDDEGRELPRGEVGELVIRGYNVMKGYFRKPEATREAFRGGWFHSGDMGTMDDDGYLRIVDRKKDLIIRGGFNVYPREVEEVLYGHPAIREAAVVGTSHPKYGEEVKAYVSLKPDFLDAPPSEAELIAYAKERLAASKYPRNIEILADLPKGSTGKILRKDLRGRERSE